VFSGLFAVTLSLTGTA